MKQRLSILIAAIFMTGFVVGCSGMSEEEAKKVDLQAKPTNPPNPNGVPGKSDRPGPGAKMQAG